MPIFRIGDKLHYYAHVPKCGGSSVEGYLRDRFGEMAFLDTAFLSLPEAQRWTKSSPQHLPLDAFHRLIPADWITSSFAVVRHPLKRLVSAFQFQVEVEKTVAPIWSIDEWFDDWVKRSEAEPFLYDNHLCPQDRIVPASATVFRLEDGLDALVPYFDGLAGDTKGPRSVEPENVRKKGMAKDDPRLKPSEETLARVAEVYAADFVRFGYDINAVPKTAHAAPKPRGLAGRLVGALAGRR